jgi:hypothetical protein
VNGGARTLILAAGTLAAAACQTASQPVAAHLDPATPEAMTAVRSVLAEAMGRTRIELGAGDPGRESVIAVLPLPIDPHEGNSLAKPTLFDILIQDGACFLRKQGEEKLYSLPSVTCRALDERS